MNRTLFRTLTATCCKRPGAFARIFLTTIFTFSWGLLQAQSTGPKLLERSISYHDPEDQWSELQAIVRYDEYRQDHVLRKTTVYFDNTSDSFKVEREVDDQLITRGTVGDSCYVLLNKDVKFTEKQRQEYNLDCERSLSYRNYYLFMQGLPMKLKDPGTIIHQKVSQETFNGQESYAIKVTYEEEVGSDTWYIYLSPENYSMLGYRFYHDESKGDGEYLELSGTKEVQGMIWPEARVWYTNQDGEYLGKDVIVEIRN